jgi:hypothetical protein
MEIAYQARRRILALLRLPMWGLACLKRQYLKSDCHAQNKKGDR